jgi:hypothetical protein
LLNGRKIPNSTGDRSFDLSNVAAQGISGVEVYKTSLAKFSPGGIGLTTRLLANIICTISCN